ncbi:MAG: hypothetical protein JW904_01250 [Spirochaetales bacterium]|nr:hypothetical protein [Spirochaetales bacterium]
MAPGSDGPNPTTWAEPEPGTGGMLVMVYIDGDNDLEKYALRDINEMEAANLGKTPVRIIVLLDRIANEDASDGDWTNTRLYEVAQDPAGMNNTIVSTRLGGMGLTVDGDEELNMGDPATLSAFIDFCISQYPASRRALVLWNHGDGWKYYPKDEESGASRAVCTDNTSRESLNLSDIRTATAGKGLSIIGFDACYMNMLETAYELKDNAHIMIGSEDVEPGNGWDYKALLERFNNSDMNPADFAEAVVTTYGAANSVYKTSLAAVDLAAIDAVMNSLNNFCDELVETPASSIIPAREAVQSFLTKESAGFIFSENIDLYDFASRIGLPGSDALQAAIDKFVLYNWCYSGMQCHGVSIYYPNWIESVIYGISFHYTTKIQFSAASQWDEFLELAVGSDMYEPDNDIDHAQLLCNDIPQNHTFTGGTGPDYFRLDAFEGGVYTITLDGVDSSSPELSIFGTDGVTELETHSSFFYFSEAVWTCPATGTYYIQARNHSLNDVMNYTISLSSSLETFTITATAGPNGSISPAGNVIATQGSNVTFGFLPGRPYTINDVYIDGVRTPVFYDAYTFCNVQENHSVHVTFMPFSSLEADVYESDNSLSKAKPIAAGDMQYRTLAPYIPEGASDISFPDEDWLVISASRFVSYRIETASLDDNTDTILTLFNSSGVQLAENDDADGTIQSKLEFVASADENYYIRVTGKNKDTGRYLIRAAAFETHDITEWCGYGWLNDAAGRWSVEGDEYVMRGIADGAVAASYMVGWYADFSFQVDFSSNAGSGARTTGIVFGHQDPENYYFFYIDDTGCYGLIKNVDGYPDQLQSSTVTGYLETGADVWNTLKVTVEGDVISCQVNGSLLGTWTEPSISAGNIGLVSGDFPDALATVIRFRNAVLE